MNTTSIHWCGSEEDRSSIYLETSIQLIKAHNRLKYTAGIMQSRNTSASEIYQLQWFTSQSILALNEADTHPISSRPCLIGD